MPDDVKNESNKLAKDVSAGAAEIKKGYEDAQKSAEDLDKAHAKLTKTQAASVKITESFTKALNSAQKSEYGLGKAGLTGAKGVKALSSTLTSVMRNAAGVAASIDGISSSVESVSGATIDIPMEVTGEKKVEKAKKKISKPLKPIKVEADVSDFSLSDAVKKEVDKADLTLKSLKSKVKDFDLQAQIDLDIDKGKLSAFRDFVGDMKDGVTKTYLLKRASEDLRGTVDKVSATFSEFGDVIASVESSAAQAGLASAIKKNVDSSAKELKGLEKKFDQASLDRRIELSMDIGSQKAFGEFVDEMADGAEKVAILKAAEEDLSATIRKTSSEHEAFASVLGTVQAESARTAADASTLASEMGDLASVTDMAKSEFVKGRAEAENFAGGIGAVNGVMIGAGAAAFFLLQKVGGLLQGFEDGAVGLAKFNVAANDASRTLGLAEGSMNSMRNELGLTRDQASAFFDVVATGVNELGMAESEFLRVGQALRSTFGGDQTERLKEYVDLLQMIPTVDTDLSITSSLDDESAALFGLAQQGKISSVIDLQGAGLLGGGAPIEMTAEDAKLINASQDTKKGVEDVHEEMLKFYPDWGPKFGAIADHTFKILAGVGGAIAMWGAMRVFLGKGQQKTTNAVKANTTEIVAAVKEAAGKAGSSSSSSARKGFGKITGRGAKRTLKRASLKVLGKKGTKKIMGTKGFKMLDKGIIKSAAKFTKLGTKITKVTANVGKFAKVGGLVGIGLTAAGMAASWMGKKLTESGHEISGAILGFTGGLVQAAGTILSFAALGSIFGPVGTAVGVVVGTLVAMATAVPAFVNQIGVIGEKFQKTVTVNGEVISKYGGMLTWTGKALVWMSDKAKAAGNLVKDAGKRIWDGIKSAGKAIKDGAKRMIQSKEFNKELDKATVAAGRLDKEIVKLKAASEAYEKVVTANRKKTGLSALSLQKEFSRLKKGLESAKFQLSDFKKEIADINIENLSEIGGSASAFSSALKMATGAVTTRFAMTTEELDKARARIKENSELEGEQRQQALMNLHKEEMKAAKAFVDGMSQVISALLKTPGLIQAGLEGEIEAAKIDIGVGGGEVSSGDLLKGASKQLESVAKEMDAFIATAPEAAAGIAKMRTEVEETKKKAEAAFADLSKQDLKIAGVDKFVDETGNIMKGKLGPAMDAVNAKTDKLNKSLTELKESLPEESIEKLALSSKSAEKGLEDAVKATQKAAEAKAKAISDKEGIKEADEELEAAKKAEAQARDASEKVSDAIKDLMSRATKDAKLTPDNKKKMEALIPAVLDAIASGKDVDPEKMIADAGVTGNVEKVVQNLTKEFTAAPEAVKEMNEKIKKLSTLANVKGPLDRVNDALDGNNKILALTRDRLNKAKEILDSTDAAAQQALKSMEVGQVEKLRRMGEQMELARAEAARTGDATEEVGKVLQNQVAQYAEQAKVAKAAIKTLEGALKNAEKAAAMQQKTVDEAKKAADAGVKGAKENLKKQQESLLIAESAVGRLKKGVAEGQRSMAEAMDGLGFIGDGISEALDGFENTFAGRKIQTALDLSEATAEFAEFSDDLAGDAKRATKLAISASKKRASLQRKLVEDGLKADQDRVNAEVSKAETPEEKERIRREGEATIEAKKRTELAKIEVQQKKSVLDAARRERDLKFEDVNIAQEGIDAELDFLNEIGGDFGRIIDLQQQGVELEAQKLGYLEQELAVAKQNAPNAQRTRRLELEVVKQQFEVQKKALGAQKSVFDKIMGAAFGQLRSSAGAGRRRTTTVAKLGIEQTRLRTRAGIYQSAGPGGAGTIAQRSAGRFAAAGKGQNAVDKAASIAPKRLAIEKEMESQMRGTEGHTKDSAVSLRSLDKMAGTKGSLMTHDATSEELLKGILRASEITAAALGVTIERTTGVVKPGDTAAPGSDAAKLMMAYEKTQKARDTKTVKLLQEISAAESKALAEAGKKWTAMRKLYAGVDQKVTLKELSKNVKLMDSDGNVKPYADFMGEIEKSIRDVGVENISGVDDTEKQVAGVAQKAAMASEATKKDVSQVVKAQQQTAMTEKQKETVSKDSISKMRTSGPTKLSGRMKFGDFTRLEGKGPASQLGKGGRKLGEGLKGAGLKARHAAAFGKKGGAAGTAASTAATGGSGAKRGGGDVAEMAASDAFNAATGGVSAQNTAAQMAWEQAGGAGKWSGLVPEPSAGAAQLAGGASSGGAAGANRVAAGQTRTLGGGGGGGATKPTAFGTGGGGGAAGTSEIPTMKVKGDMMVKFDMAALKDTLVPVVGQIINSPQIVKSLQKAGFINRNN